ncbi:MAG: uracil-DNA glycosylase [Cellvibrionaceae bacterium]
MIDNNIQLEQSWLNHLQGEFDEAYMQQLWQFLRIEKRKEKIIYPKDNLIFNAFNSTSLDKLKVVILGQDPYHGPNQAHGLCFSVLPGTSIPPSLKNIFKEMERDLGLSRPTNGCLRSWAEQGVLLLNATLTVEHSNAGSHQGKGWEAFTDRAIEVVNQQCEDVVFLLWGAYAQKKGQLIDCAKHHVLKSPHPSPLSAHKGFVGNSHFSLTNEWLSAKGKSPINWAI